MLTHNQVPKSELEIDIRIGRAARGAFRPRPRLGDSPYQQ